MGLGKFLYGSLIWGGGRAPAVLEYSTVWACLNNSTRSTHRPPGKLPGKQAVMTGSALALKPQVTSTVEPAWGGGQTAGGTVCKA